MMHLRKISEKSNIIFNEFFAGFASSIIIIIMATVVAALIFNETLSKYFALGLFGGLFGSFFANLLGAIYGSIRGSIFRVEPAIAPIIGIIFLNITHSGISQNEILPTLLVTTVIITISSGLIIYILGYCQLSKIARFLPYPVLGGIISGIAWIMIQSSYALINQNTIHANPNFFILRAYQWIIIISIIAILTIFSKKDKNLWLMPMLVILMTILINIILSICEISYQDGIKMGWLFEGLSTNNLLTFAPTHQNLSSLIYNTDLESIFSNLWYIITIPALIIIFNIFNLSSIELYYNAPIATDHELKICGLGNIINGLFFLYPTNISLTGTILNQGLGGVTRLSTLFSSLIGFVILVLFPSVLQYIPKPVIIGLLMYFSIKLLINWVYEGYKKLPFHEYLIVLFILSIIMAWGILPGFFLGIIITCLFFIWEYSNSDVIRFTITGKDYNSNVTRSQLEKEILTREGSKIAILKIQNYIFFGSIESLLDKIMLYFTSNKFKYTIIDFELVNGIDSSTSNSFIKLRKYATQYNIHLIFTSCSKSIMEQLNRQQVLSDNHDMIKTFSSLDHGLEWCENHIIQHNITSKITPSITIKDIFRQISNNEKHIELLMKHIHKIEVEKNNFLFRQNDMEYSLYFLESGKMSILLSGNKTDIRVAQLNNGAFIGEIGFILQCPRSASVVADTKCSLYIFTQENYALLKKDHPNLIITFDEFIMKLLSQRLIKTNKLLQLNHLHGFEAVFN